MNYASFGSQFIVYMDFSGFSLGMARVGDLPGRLSPAPAWSA